MRTVIAILEVDDDRAFTEIDDGPIPYLEREMGWLEQSGIFLQNARILDEDDEYDAKAIELADKIFNEEDN